MSQSLYEILCSQEAELEKTLEAIRVLKNQLKHNSALFGQPLIHDGKIKHDGTVKYNPINVDLQKFNVEASYEVKQAKKLFLPTEYSTHLNQMQKTYVGLYKIGGGYVEDIVNSLLELDPDLEPEKVNSFVTYYASFLYRAGQIRAKKNGVKHFYYIKSAQATFDWASLNKPDSTDE